MHKEFIFIHEEVGHKNNDSQLESQILEFVNENTFAVLFWLGP